MIDTDKYEEHTPAPWLWYEEDEGLDLVVADDQCRTVIEEVKALNTKADAELIADAPLILQALIDERAEVKRLREENKILAKYMDIVQKYDDALLADGDTDPRWSELYD